jgi:hypothetical protein
MGVFLSVKFNSEELGKRVLEGEGSFKGKRQTMNRR